jgi:two-component system response regulator QseB
MLARLLREEGFAVSVAGDGRRGLHLALVHPYDVMILDRSLPAVEGLTVLETLRERGVTTPVLILSARNEIRDRIDGLDAGAESYLGKPFDVDELVARLRALLRRYPRRSHRVDLGAGRSVDLDSWVVESPGQTAQLTEKEAVLLGVLAERPGHVVSRSDLHARVFPAADTENVVDTYVSTVRRKLGRDIIVTVYGVGFRLGT